MKVKTLKPTKVNVIALGCSKNTFDSEVLMAQLKANDIAVEHESASGDHNVVVIDTCGFIDNAKQESIDTILNYANAGRSRIGGEGICDRMSQPTLRTGTEGRHSPGGCMVRYA